jgi:glycogen operon protein
MSSLHRVTAGRPWPLGSSFDGEGVNFAVFSQHATRMVLCLFSGDGRRETAQLELIERDGDVWHGYVAGLRPGQAYGFRAHGPYAPAEGHRFNPNKLLVDPYARRLSGQPVWNPALMGYRIDAPHADLTFDLRDSAPFAPRGIVVADRRFDGTRPGTRWRDTVIYEAHVKGMTARRGDAGPPGKFLALASDPVLDHLVKLGITAIELLPVQAFITDHFLQEKGLTNYWGYQTIGFFAPDTRYLSDGDITEFRRMVDRFHGAGIEVIMDVVYNHTGEGNELGPTLSFRGLDNASYYRLLPDRRYYANDAGTGNVLNIAQPMVLRMVMDSLRYWVEVMGVDGFRFDLAASLGRTAAGFSPGAAVFDAVRQDPVLQGVKMIAEPWDIGPGGYQLGAFPPPFHEWNDRFRDGVRRFWRGDGGMAPDLAERITGSAGLFDHTRRPATTSINLVTSHDGFTLHDLVSYREKHNEANGEGNRDGHSDNHSDNMGVEGPASDPAVVAARLLRKRNMLATLMLSQGTPMLLAGDELGHSQGGNNNAYAQDNATSWIDWDGADEDLIRFTRRLIAFRKAHPVLRQKLFLHSRERSLDGKEDIFWRRTDGQPMGPSDWQDPNLRVVCVELRTASATPAYDALEYAIFAVLNAGAAITVTVPEAPPGEHWWHEIDTARPGMAPVRLKRPRLPIAAQSVSVLVLGDAP